MKYVVIGNSAAAIGCIEGIRTVDQASPIVLLSSEPYHTYSRPLISYLLGGKSDRHRMKYRPDDFYESMRVKPCLGVTVRRIDAQSHTAILSGGDAVPYEKLLIATGSSPIIPPVEGLDGVKNQFTFLSLRDALALEGVLRPEHHVLIVGAGLIGLKCAEGIHDRTAQITIVDRAPQILPSVLDEEGAKRMQRHLEERGIAFRLNDSVQAFEGNTARLASGQSIDFDVLVLAVGVRPNVDLAREAGADVGRGIRVDARGRTSIADVYAAGDCVESYDLTTHTTRVLALLPNAYMQGHAAGVSMAGGGEAFERAIPMNAMGLFDLHMITAGSYEGEVHQALNEGSYKKLFVRDGRLVGYILMGEIENAGIYTALIREETPLNQVDFPLIFDKPQLMAFSRPVRMRKMGGR